VSSNPSEYLAEIVLNRFLKELSGYDEDSFFPAEFLESFVVRLILEKPDFNSEDKTGISLILLFSGYISSKLKQGYQIEALSEGPNALAFESFVALHLSKKAMIHIFGAYDFKSKNKEEYGRFVKVSLREEDRSSSGVRQSDDSVKWPNDI